jgi:hypothetical protein
MFTNRKIYLLVLLAGLLLSSCGRVATVTPTPTAENGENGCPVTQPAWVKPPEDPAVGDAPEYGSYFANPDQSILASAWWTGQEETRLQANGEGVKIGWFRPEGADLEISGRRIDAEAPPLEVEIPCCYPTRFQSTRLIFPAGGCWEITGIAAKSILTFVVSVEP